MTRLSPVLSLWYHKTVHRVYDDPGRILVLWHGMTIQNCQGRDYLFQHQDPKLLKQTDINLCSVSFLYLDVYTNKELQEDTYKQFIRPTGSLETQFFWLLPQQKSFCLSWISLHSVQMLQYDQEDFELSGGWGCLSKKEMVIMDKSAKWPSFPQAIGHLFSMNKSSLDFWILTYLNDFSINMYEYSTGFWYLNIFISLLLVQVYVLNRILSCTCS